MMDDCDGNRNSFVCDVCSSFLKNIGTVYGSTSSIASVLVFALFHFCLFVFHRACTPHYFLRHEETLDVDFMVDLQRKVRPVHSAFGFSLQQT